MEIKVSSITKLFAGISTNDASTQCKLVSLPYADLKMPSSNRDKHRSDEIIESTEPYPFKSFFNLSEIANSKEADYVLSEKPVSKPKKRERIDVSFL